MNYRGFPKPPSFGAMQMFHMKAHVLHTKRNITTGTQDGCFANPLLIQHKASAPTQFAATSKMIQKELFYTNSF
jgi:hypothetical protein